MADDEDSLIFNVKITKAKANLAVNFGELPRAVQEYIIEQGLAKLLNGATAKETAATTPDEAVRAANAMSLAEKKLDSLKAGKIVARASKDGKVAGVVMTEARRLAKNIVKAGIKAQNKRISDFEPKAITEAANAYLADHPELIAAAKASIDASAALSAATVVNVEAIPVSATRVAANEKKKAEAKAATAAKNAGKPGPQASATARRAPPPPARRPAPTHAAPAGQQ